MEERPRPLTMLRVFARVSPIRNDIVEKLTVSIPERGRGLRKPRYCSTKQSEFGLTERGIALLSRTLDMLRDVAIHCPEIAGFPIAAPAVGR